MKKLTEIAISENESFLTPAQVLEEAANSNLSAEELIDNWVEKYLNGNGLPKNKRDYAHEAGTSIMTVLNRYGYEIVKKK